MVESAAAKDSRQKEAAEAGSTTLASWKMLGYAQCPALQATRGTRLIAEASFAGYRIPVPEKQTNQQYQ